MELPNLTVSIREGKGKGAARRVRRGGEVPGMVYGGGREPVSVIINLKEFQRLLHGGAGEHAVLQLVVTGRPELGSPALLKMVQRHPVSENILHADFLRIRLDERIQTFVPTAIVGQAKGVVDGGVLEQTLREIEVECLALEVPAQITVDVSELGIGDSIHVSQLVPPEGVRILTEGDRTVVSIHVPRVIREAVEEAEAVPAEGEEGAPKEGEAEAGAGAEEAGKPAKAGKPAREKEKEKD